MNEVLITFLASFLIWFMFAGLLVLWLIDGRIKKEQVLHALVASILAWVIAQVIKSLVPTLRPFEVNQELPMTLTIQTDSAFPSGHAALAFGLATTLWLHNKKLGFIFLVSALVVGVARVLSNVHYPQDILGGALLGLATAFVVERLHVYKLLRGEKIKLDF